MWQLPEYCFHLRLFDYSLGKALYLLLFSNILICGLFTYTFAHFSIQLLMLCVSFICYR